MAATQRLLYLHGFRSSPKSFKAVRLQAWLQAHRPEVHWACPQLPASPAEAMALITALTQDWPVRGSTVIGSSLGGFYATALAEARGFAAVLLNPAVDPARDLAPHVGEHAHYHDPDQRFHFRAGYLEALRTLSVPAITRPERYAALIAKGDEVLDWREMCARYPGADIRLLDGSDHGLSDFDAHLPWLLAVLGLG
ncbi:MAG: esterase [Burkholderiales bacterium]|nr:esterase [Burkholderiales bacterium]